MEEATHAALGLIVTELIVVGLSIPAEANPSTYLDVFVISYLLCIGAVLLNVRSIPFFQSSGVRNFIKILHMLDGVIAMLIGYAISAKDKWLLIFGVLCITKFFLLYLLSRMVTGVQTHSTFAIVVQTTKTYIHHVGSFFFIRDPRVAILTGIWRFISMNGHAALTLRDHMAPATYDRIMWTITHMRNAAMVCVLYLCYSDNDIRKGFGVSGMGHAAYLLVRMGPVFRLGSLYITHHDEREKWGKLSDLSRLKQILSGQHPWFALELGLLFTTFIVMLALRLQY